MEVPEKGIAGGRMAGAKKMCARSCAVRNREFPSRGGKTVEKGADRRSYQTIAPPVAFLRREMLTYAAVLSKILYMTFVCRRSGGE